MKHGGVEVMEIYVRFCSHGKVGEKQWEAWTATAKTSWISKKMPSPEASISTFYKLTVPNNDCL